MGMERIYYNVCAKAEIPRDELEENIDINYLLEKIITDLENALKEKIIYFGKSETKGALSEGEADFFLIENGGVLEFYIEDCFEVIGHFLKEERAERFAKILAEVLKNQDLDIIKDAGENIIILRKISRFP